MIAGGVVVIAYVRVRRGMTVSRLPGLYHVHMVHMVNMVMRPLVVRRLMALVRMDMVPRLVPRPVRDDMRKRSDSRDRRSPEVGD
jgi:hypothetical protein